MDTQRHLKKIADAEANAEVRRVQVAERALAGVSRMFRIQVASLKLDMAKLRRNWAGQELDHAALVLKIKEWESRTGLDHHVLLRGDFDNPYGDGS